MLDSRVYRFRDIGHERLISYSGIASSLSMVIDDDSNGEDVCDFLPCLSVAVTMLGASTKLLYVGPAGLLGWVAVFRRVNHFGM